MGGREGGREGGVEGDFICVSFRLKIEKKILYSRSGNISKFGNLILIGITVFLTFFVHFL